MNTDINKRITTLTAAVVITLAVGTGSVYAQGGVPTMGDNGNGTITDSAGLVWLKNACCFGSQNWQTAKNSAASLRSGSCGLTDKSTAGQWRLPTKDEIVRRSKSVNGFNNVQGGMYWTGTEYDSNKAWGSYIFDETVGTAYKYGLGFVWPVRAGL